MNKKEMSTGEVVATGAALAFGGLALLNYFAGVALVILAIVGIFS